MSAPAQALHRTPDAAKKVAHHAPVLVSSQTEGRALAPVVPEAVAEPDARVPNPLWVITISMAVFFGFTALLMIGG